MEIASIRLIIIGFLVGALGTLIGAGGGFVLVPVLALLYPDLKPDEVTSISLAVVFLNSASGSVAYARMRRIDYKSAIIFGLATLPGAVIGAFITKFIPRHLFNIVLGFVLIVLALFLFVKPHQKTASPTRKSGSVHRHIIDVYGTVYEYSFNTKTGVVISFFTGFVSSVLGIGGGIIHVPALTRFLDFPAHIATATSHFVLAIMALAGTIVHLSTGTLQGGIKTVLYIGAGVILGAQLGALLSHKIKATAITRVLAIALILVGIRLLMNG